MSTQPQMPYTERLSRLLYILIVMQLWCVAGLAIAACITSAASSSPATSHLS